MLLEFHAWWARPRTIPAKVETLHPTPIPKLNPDPDSAPRSFPPSVHGGHGQTPPPAEAENSRGKSLTRSTIIVEFPSVAGRICNESQRSRYMVVAGGAYRRVEIPISDPKGSFTSFFEEGMTMAESHEKNLPRRDFLKSAAAAAFVGTCLETDFREAIAAAKQAGKPMLTEKGINDFIASKSKEQLRPLMEEARHDLRAFIRKHFYVAPQQEKELTALDEADIRKLNDALGTALKQNLKPQANS